MLGAGDPFRQRRWSSCPRILGSVFARAAAARIVGMALISPHRASRHKPPFSSWILAPARIGRECTSYGGAGNAALARAMVVMPRV